MHLRSLEGCRLTIGSYPPFIYNATGGGGVAKSLPTSEENILHITFTPETFSIPPLNSQTTKFLSLPLPPGLKIKMAMDKLDGTFNQRTGELLLGFESRFIFTVGSIYHFPDLIVKTSLETGHVKGTLHERQGERLQSDGKATLVGIAIIPVTSNKILDLFLNLPTEALAVLKCKIK